MLAGSVVEMSVFSCRLVLIFIDICWQSHYGGLGPGVVSISSALVSFEGIVIFFDKIFKMTSSRAMA